MTSVNLGARAIAGGRAVAVVQVLRFGLQLLGMIALSWLVSPADFGLVAIVVAVLGVADVLRDLGLSTAAVQARTLSSQQASNLFWLNLLVGVLMAGMALVGAPMISSVAGDDRLIGIASALSVSVVLNAAQPQFQANLLRSLQFERVAVTELASVGIGLIAGVVMAVMGWGYWALVGQILSQAAALLLLRVAVSSFRPGLPRRGAEMRGLLTFGANLAGPQVLVYLSSNLDTIIMGARYSPDSVGQYRRASQLVSLPLVQLMTPLTSVAVAALSRCVEESDRFWRYFRRAQMASGYPAAIGLALGAINAGWLVELLFGPAWQQTASFLRILCLAGVLQITAYPLYWAFLALGRTRDHLGFSIVSRSILVISVLVGSLFGEFGVPLGYVVGVAIGWPFGFWWLARIERRPIRELIATPLRTAGVAMAMVLAGWVGPQWIEGGSVLHPAVVASLAAIVILVVVLCLNRKLRTEIAFAVRQVVGRIWPAMGSKGSDVESA